MQNEFLIQSMSDDRRRRSAYVLIRVTRVTLLDELDTFACFHRQVHSFQGSSNADNNNVSNTCLLTSSFPSPMLYNCQIAAMGWLITAMIDTTYRIRLNLWQSNSVDTNTVWKLFSKSIITPLLTPWPSSAK